ncbi:MAG: DoxX family protein [Acidobacteriota bacterium]
MNKILWILQVLLAVAFLAHGWFIIFPPAEVVPQMAAFPTAFWIFLGVAEILAGVGLTLPGITGILPWLVPSAAVGLMVVMVGATILHGTRGEVGPALTTVVLFVLLTFVAYMRWKVRPIARRHAV